ncbi:MAG: peptidoglycan DD-metalloendopeptidase family protein [Pseudomonadota bacterium]|nr:peptidoglycan DD-metalloendopeptidase family protein [Pseudomonadota bacterium]
MAVATPLRAEGEQRPAAAVRKAPVLAGTAALPALEWGWPVDTPIVVAYSDSAKGIDFSGATGLAVRAAAAGEVSYVGSSLRGYGLMVVIKHDKGYLSVYAHNHRIAVKLGQRVERGQKIAEMGNTDSKDVTLHFELRHQGRPLDPAQVLPAR